MSETKTPTRVWRRQTFWSPQTFVGIGVLLVPSLLRIAATAWAGQDAAGYVCVAFADVIGATIAIVTVVALFAFFVRRRSPYLFWYGLGAAVVVAVEVSFISGAANELLFQLTLS